MKAFLSRSSHKFRQYLWILPALGAGITIRFYHLSSQIIGGDEIHTVRIALQKPLGWILTHYVSTDNCIPLTAFYRVQMDLGAVFTEMAFRLPVLVLGIVFLIIAPLALKEKIGKRPAIVFSWLIALSPLLVFYSRMVRPYMANVLLGFAAVMCFFVWLDRGNKPASIAYAVLSASAIFFHLTTAPFVLAPLAYFIFDWGTRKDRDHKEFVWFLVVAGCTAGFILLFLIPALPSLIPFVTEKAMDSSIRWRTAGGFSHLFAGTSRPLMTVLFWILCVWGLAKLLIKNSRFGLYCLWLIVAQLSAILIVSPFGVISPLIFSRYALVTLPFILVWLASGLAGPWWKNQNKPARWAQKAFAMVFVAVLFLTGPLTKPQFFAGSFAHHTYELNFQVPSPSVSDDMVPRFYRKLEKMPAGALIEYPWDWIWPRSMAFDVYQNRHRREVIVSGAWSLFADDRIKLRNNVPVSPKLFLSSRAKYIVVHLDLFQEEKQVISSLHRAYRASRLSQKNFWDRMKKMGTGLADKLERLWGPPSYRDRFIRVWDLDKVRDRNNNQ